MATEPPAGRPKSPRSSKGKAPAPAAHPRRPFWAALLLTALGFLVMQGLERALFAPIGLVQWFEERAVVLPAALRLPQPGSDARVVVIDIDELNVRRSALPGGIELTPRDQLLDLVDACLEAGAQGVGVDLDFGEGKGFLANGPRSQAEFEAKQENDTFVARIAARQRALDAEGRGRRIVLGVKRSESKGPAGWLGSRLFAGLAGTIGVTQDSPARLTRWLRPVGKAEDQTLRSLSAALAEAEENRPARTMIDGLLEPHTEKHIGGEMGADQQYLVAEYFFDPQEVVRVTDSKITVSSPDPESASAGFGLTDEDLATLSGALVVIGDVSSRMEGVTRVPGLGRDVPGTLIHAAGVATLATRPYRSVKSGLAPFFDLGFALVAVSLAYATKAAYSRRADLSPERLNKFVTKIFFALCLVTGFALVYTLRIVWEGYLWAALTLPVGNVLEDRIPAFGKWLDRVIIAAGSEKTP